jgi:hypothetical protein
MRSRLCRTTPVGLLAEGYGRTRANVILRGDAIRDDLALLMKKLAKKDNYLLAA